MTATIHLGDCREIIATLDDNSIDAIVTDPPYELGFMGKKWDNTGIAYDVNLWTQCLRVLKPGGHLLAFGGTRTYHRMASAIEDAGFEIRDSIHWLYGSGFPKSLDVSKAIDKAAGAEREVVGTWKPTGTARRSNIPGHGAAVSNQSQAREFRDEALPVTAPATDAARQWEGWGTALKPAHEPIVMARKPLVGTVAANVLQHGTGALNIDSARVGNDVLQINTYDQRGPFGESQVGNGYASKSVSGRWPANIVFTHGAECADDCAEDCPVFALDQQSGNLRAATSRTNRVDRGPFSTGESDLEKSAVYGDSGGASRFFAISDWDDITPFFYCAKPSKAERNAGLDALPEVTKGSNFGNDGACPHTKSDYVYSATTRNTHPTVKPLALMRYLVRLVTPPGGTVLEPFAGSGTTLAAAILEGFDAIGCELTADYLPIIEGRIAWAQQQTEPDQESLFNQ